MKQFSVWCPDLDQKAEDGVKISAIDAQQATEEWAEWQDRNTAEYSIVGGQAEDVMVRDLDTRALFAFRVSGESVPEYRARDISCAA